MNAVNLVSGRADAAKWIERLREAALLDENGEALDGAIKTIETIT
jgi:indolepyruvate ferredoxin oxidoreductase beta subunit